MHLPTPFGERTSQVASGVDIETFGERWSAIDADGDGFIAAEALPALLLSLDRPLRPLGLPEGGAGPANRARTRRIVKRLVESRLLPERFASTGYVTYRFVLDTLVSTRGEARGCSE